MSSLHQKIGSMLVVGFDGIHVNQNIRHMIHHYHVGGIILFGRNIGAPQEVLQLTTDLQNEAKKAGYDSPLLICIDQENGVVRRLKEGTTEFPGSMLIGASGNPENAYHIGKATGEELKALGINWNLAPSVDVNVNQNNPVIGVRSFGESPESVSDFSKETIRGLRDAGVLTTLKHFPGHGDTEVDSHLGLPVISHTKDRLKKVELKPFQECIQSGVDTVMSAHIYLPSVEQEYNRPATLSESIITGLLREEMGYDGVVTTDCLEMEAISQGIGTPRGAVEAVLAGVDIAMVSHTYAEQVRSIEAILEAVEQGEISEARIDESCERILKMKQMYLGWDELDESIEVSSVVGGYDHKQLAQKVAREGVTLVSNHNVLPLHSSQKVLFVFPRHTQHVQVEDPKEQPMSLGDIAQNYSGIVDTIEMNNPADKEEIDQVVERAQDYDAIVVGTVSVHFESFQVQLVQRLKEKALPVVVVATRNPYDKDYLPEVDAYIATFEYTNVALEAAVAGMYGGIPFKGALPVSLHS